MLDNGYNVISIDNMSNGQIENAELFKDNPHFKFYCFDLAKEFDDSIFKDVSYVFHMAGLADIVPSIENPIKYYESNVTATVRVLEASRKHSIEKLVYSASSSCYGIPDKSIPLGRMPICGQSILMR